MINKNYTPIDPDLIGVDDLVAVSKPKEAEPIPLSQEKINSDLIGVDLKEAVEYKPEEEVRPFVTPRSETIEILPDLKKMGVTTTTTTQFPTYQNVKLPIADEKIVVALHAPVTSSIRWLATLAIYILRMAHLTLKTIHGKVVRVFRY